MKIEALRAVPLFRALDDEAANELCELLTMRDVTAGTSLFHRGEPGDAMYLIENGRVRISLKDTDGHDATLAEMADLCPDSLDALAGISGVGARKLDAYGEQILAVLRPG